MQSFSERQIVLYDGWMRKFSESNTNDTVEMFHKDWCNDELSAVIQVPASCSNVVIEAISIAH